MVLIPEVRNHRRDTSCPGTFGGCDSEEKLHDVVVHRGSTGLNDEHVLLTNTLIDTTADLSVREPVDVGVAQIRVEDGADLRGELPTGCDIVSELDTHSLGSLPVPEMITASACRVAGLNFISGSLMAPGRLAWSMVTPAAATARAATRQVSMGRISGKLGTGDTATELDLGRGDVPRWGITDWESITSDLVSSL